MTSQVSAAARIGHNVTIGPFTVVHDNVEIGDDTVVESHCQLGYPTRLAEGRPLTIGPGALIRSHSVFYEGSSFGPGLFTGNAVMVRENTRAGVNLQIGTQSDIQGDCALGDWVRLHSGVHVAKGSQIGDFVWLLPRVVFTNDPFPPTTIIKGVVVRDMAVIATGAILLPGITIGLGSFVGAGSLVRSDVPDIHCVSGNPATVFTTLDRFFNIEYSLSYPWPKHFRKNFPPESFPRMEATAGEIQRLIDERRADCRRPL